MVTVQEALAVAVDHHRAGRLAPAADLYRRILDVDAGHIDALHLLGRIEQDRGALPQALELIGRAVAAGPALAPLRLSLADVLQAAGRVDEAKTALRRAIALDPGHATAHHRLGGLLCGRGGPDHWPEAVTVLTRATLLAPDLAGAFHDLGVALRQTEKTDAAVGCYVRAIALQGDMAAARMSLGNALVELGDHAAAVASFRRGLALVPAGPELYYNLGNALHAQGAPDGALNAYARAARLGLNNALVRVAAVLIHLARLPEAEATLRRALTLPGVEVATAIDLLVSLMIEGGRAGEARRLFEALTHAALGDGRAHPGECLTALAILDLHDDQPHVAAARLARVRGDDCRLFTVKSLAAFRAALADMGATLTRPVNPDRTRPRVASSTLATHGRFAHNALEYVMVRLYAEKYGYTLETPDWVGGWFFDLDDPAISGPLSPLAFPRRIINGLVTGDSARPPIPDCDILSPLFLFEHKEAYRERVQSWLKPRAVWRPFLDPAMARLRAQGDTVVAVHIRRGDFVQYKYPITETAWYVEWLRQLWPTLERPVLYLASDDLAGVRQDFAEFSPLTLEDVATPWAGLEYLQDFHVLMHADVVGVSAASGYSLLAARLNAGARLFVEPDVRGRRIRPFSPWTA